MHCFILAGVNYLIVMMLPRDQQQKLAMVWNLGYLSCQHIYSMWNDFGGYNADVTTYTMVLIAKLWGFSWAYRDGMFD